jgi:hypothetical protein
MNGGFGGGSGIFGKKDAAADAAKREAVSKLGKWLEQILPDEERWEELPGGKAPMGKETNVIINQLACQEDGCPDVELVITLRRPKPQPKLMFKIYKAAADLSHEQLEKALMQAKAWEETVKPDAEAVEGGKAVSTEIFVVKLDEDEVDNGHADDSCDGHEHADETTKPDAESHVAEKMEGANLMPSVEGVWDFAWEKGSFPIEFRPKSVFFCEQYQAHAHWSLTGDKISINWVS